MNKEIYSNIIATKSAKRKMFVVLLDPDKCYLQDLPSLVGLLRDFPPDYIFVGGSQTLGSIDWLIELLKNTLTIPIILFPGHMSQFTASADGLLYLSLISGRNPEYLIEQHVSSATMIRRSAIEVISIGYILIDGGKESAVQTVSRTLPLSSVDIEKIVATALAGEMLGLKMIYLEAGSGAINPIDPKIISETVKNITVPLIVGGGIQTAEKMMEIFTAGADIVVVGNVFEKKPELIKEFWLKRNS